MPEAATPPPTASLVVRLRYQPLCSTCTNVISHGFHGENDRQSKQWDWSMEALLQNTISCRCCVFLLQVLEASPWLVHRNDSNVRLSTTLVGSQHSSPFEKPQNEMGQQLIKHGPAQTTEYKRYYRPQLMVGDQCTVILPAAKVEANDTEDVDPGSAFCGRAVGPEANFSLIRNWLNLCVTNHQSPSHGEGLHAWYEGTEEHSTSGRGCSPVISDPIPNFRLVDVKMRCIVPIEFKTDYAALSYVWGDSKRVSLCKDNADALSLPGALDHESLDLPRTFTDAIEIAEKLSMRYIWIDALCILQDNSDQLVQHMNSMDLIYSAAALTIVSDAESADTGIPGLSTSRKPPQATFQHKGTQYISAKKTFGQALQESPWERRAWCLQEKVFSNRLLVLTETQTFYHCAAATWFEDTQLESKPNIAGPVHIREKPSRTRKEAMMFKASTQIAYESHRDYFGRNFWRLIENYSQRSLSFEADAIRAFSGILRSIEQQHGVAVWGIPQREFGRGISFEHSPYQSGMRREGFPSWTWAGWRTSADTSLKFVNFKRKDSDMMVSEGQYRVDRNSGTHSETSFFDVDWHYYSLDNAAGDPTLAAIQKTFQEPTGATAQGTSANTRTDNSSLSSAARPLKPERVSLWGIPGHPGEKDYIPTTAIPPLQHEQGMPPINHILQFYTSAAPIIVGSHKSTGWRGLSRRTLHVPGSNDALEFSVNLDSAYDSKGQDMWLVYVSRWCTTDLMAMEGRRRRNRGTDRLNLLLVESVAGWRHVKRRVQLLECIWIDWWGAANPQWQLISLA
ncbi:hypothetical protein J1614_009676 [Plenodomus biglobosus]|nr:hypothetical protein J1614_009676 [Plenodomus biglobosus]